MDPQPLPTPQPGNPPSREKADGSFLHGGSFPVRIDRKIQYRVQVAPGLLEEYGETLASLLGRREAFILTDKRVGSLYGERLEKSLGRAGIPSRVLSIPGGEESKSLAVYGRLLERLAEMGCARRSLLVNFGGGVVSDLGGFLASSYMRGIDYVNLPTSLLAQVDAAVGGKVGVNTGRAKNLVGAFHHPRHVAADTELLATLPARDFAAGLAEAVKTALIDGEELFGFLEANRRLILERDPLVTADLVFRTSNAKMRLIAKDPFEKDLRRELNLGHTLGHPIETEFRYRGIRHGEAVAVGMGVACLIAAEKGLLDPPLMERIFDLLRDFGLLWEAAPIPPDKVVDRLRYIKLIRGGHLHFVLPAGIGRVVITDRVSEGELIRGLEEYEAEVERRKK